MQILDLYFTAKSIANSKAFMEDFDPSIGTRIVDKLRFETSIAVISLISDNVSHRKYVSYRFDTTYLTDSIYSNRKIYKTFGHNSNITFW